MALVYSDTEPYTGPPIPYNRLNATKSYVRHYSNYLYLSFFLNNGNRIEKQQASRELAICERKMEYMRRHPNFDRERARQEQEQLKKNWNLQPSPARVAAV